MTSKRFSQQLEDLLRSKKSPTLHTVVNEFAHKGFAILCFLLMAIPALPIPTGGITHIFEIIVMLLGLEMIAGRDRVWLPKKWLQLKLSGKLSTSGLPKLMSLVRKVEKYSRPRLGKVMSSRTFTRLTGLVISILALFAFLAPPFSGLDTLPSLGVVLVSLGILLDDIILGAIGIIVGIFGIGLVLTLGSVVFRLL